MSSWVPMLIAALTGVALGVVLRFGSESSGKRRRLVGTPGRVRQHDSDRRDSDARYRLLAENATDVIWAVSWPDLKYTYVSPSITRLRGISVDAAMQERFPDSVVPEQREWVERMIVNRVRAFQAGRFEQSEAQRVQIRQQCSDGTEKTVEIIASLSVGDNGEIDGIQGISRDVSARVQAEGDRKAREAILHALARAARMLFSATDKHELMEPVLAVLGQAVDVDRVYVFENHRDPRTGELLASQRYEWCGPGIVPELENPDMQSMSYDRVIPNWRPILESGEAVHGMVDEMSVPERGLLEPQHILSIVVVPIFLDGKFWGQIGFDDCSRRREWSQPEIDALEIAAGVIGGAINSIRIEEELRRLVSTDSLTGVASRRAFLDQARALFHEVGPQDEGLALLIMDLDHFKAINDTHGHPAGDEALRAFARICRQTLRPDDLVGRTGGEEFAVLLRSVDSQQALMLAEKIRRNVSSQPVQTDSVDFEMTVSIGVAVAECDETRFASLLKRADEALYVAKKSGRDRVELAVQD